MILFFSFLFSFYFLFSNDRVVAVVGEKPILESSVNEQVAAYMQASGVNQNLDSLKKDILNYLIEQEVFAYFAKKDTLLSVDPSQVDAVVGERLLFFKNQLGSVGALEDYFGLDYRDIKIHLEEEAYNMFLSDMFKRKLMSYVGVSEEEVRSFYLTYKDSLPLTPKLYSYSCFHKNLLSSGNSVKRAKEKALDVFSKISQGASFEGFYSLFSGGDLNYFRRGTFVQEFEEVAFSLKEGEVSRPVLSPLGFHIIRLNDRLGEKINASHILFEIKETDEDFNFLKESLVSLKESCLKKGDGFCDSLLKADASFGELSGVFSFAPENIINTDVLTSLNGLSDKKIYSDVFSLKGGSFFFVRLDSLVEPKTPDMYEYWGFVEGLALENKFNLFLKNWYVENKNKVYIKVFN